MKNFLEKVQENGLADKKTTAKKTEGVTELGRKNKTGESKVESNDSAEIPNRGRHQTFPASLWKGFRKM